MARARGNTSGGGVIASISESTVTKRVVTWSEMFTTLFVKSPQEHLNGMWRVIKALPSVPPEGHVRVQVYLGWKEGCDEDEFCMRYSALVGDIKLEKSGRLSLLRIKNKWRLRDCKPIDPSRRTTFKASNPHFLSPLAIQVLTDSSGTVKLYEPAPTPGIVLMRDVRVATICAYSNFIDIANEATFGRIVDRFGYVGAGLVFMLITLGVPLLVLWYLLSKWGWVDPVEEVLKVYGVSQGFAPLAGFNLNLGSLFPIVESGRGRLSHGSAF